MREMKFKIEREGVLTAGETVNVIESELPSSYYYTIENSLGMSANYSALERLKSTSGLIKALDETPRGFYATIVFDEDEP